MNIQNKPIEEHINNIACVFDKFCEQLTPDEKISLNAAMQVLDSLNRNNGVLILKQ